MSEKTSTDSLTQAPFYPADLPENALAPVAQWNDFTSLMADVIDYWQRSGL